MKDVKEMTDRELQESILERLGEISGHTKFIKDYLVLMLIVMLIVIAYVAYQMFFGI